jgi:hypothetical protein
MKLAAAVFFGLLVYAHYACGLDAPITRTLCSFRDGEAPWVGYALIGMIAVIGGFYALDFNRLGRSDDAPRAIAFGLVLLIAAATPPWWPLHDACAIVLLSSVYFHMTGVLLERNRTLMWLHLAVPFVLAAGLRFSSYGVWQKGMISYFIVAYVLHHHVIVKETRARSDVGDDIAMPSAIP